MAEYKRTFSKAKMNKDADERTLPPGEYRDANNIEIVTSEGSSVGTVQSVLGNVEKTELSASAVANPSYAQPFHLSHHTAAAPGTSTQGSPSVCVASIADEKNDKIYSFIKDGLWYISGTATTDNDYLRIRSDYILEYDVNPIQPAPTYPYKYVFNDIWMVETETNAETQDTNEISVASNQGIRPGMIVNFSVDTNDSGSADAMRTGKVKHIFTNDSGSTTISTNKVFLENSFTGDLLDNTDIVFYMPEEDRPLNFTILGDNIKDKITGINIIDDFIFWTDNNDEPKKISIARSKAGTGGVAYNANNFLPATSGGTYSNAAGFKGESRHYHTRLFAELDPEGNVAGTTGQSLQCVTNDAGTFPVFVDKSHVTVIKKAPTTPPTLEMSSTSIERTNTQTKVANLTHNSRNFAMVNADSDIVSPGDMVTITFIFNLDWREGDIIICTSEEPANPTFFTPHEIRFVVDGTGTSGAVTDPDVLQNTFDLKVLSVSSPDLQTEEIQWWFALLKDKPMFEMKFPRFAYRYKYTDGEYSPISPWSQIAFMPGPYNYRPNEGYNLGMTNQLRALKIKDYLVDTDYRPRDIVEVDLLYKEEASPNVYTVKTVNRKDSQNTSLTPLMWPDLSISNYTEERGEYLVTSEMIHAAIPQNQTIRPYDNIPRKALAQEITGNRLVYGNYLQNYNLFDGAMPLKPEIDVSLESNELLGYNKDFSLYLDLFGGFTVNIPGFGGILKQPEKSVKTLRTYQIGVVYCDRFGRETPVIAPKGNNSLYIDKEFADKKNALKVSLKTLPPDWSTHYKYFIKETSSEYYNLSLDRWYNADDGNIWLSFPSSERNKVDIETFLILKKGHGSSTIITEKARYKILAIENEAPDFIKINTQLLGTMGSSAFKDEGYPLPDLAFLRIDAQLVDGAYGKDVGTDISDLVKYVTDNKLFYRAKSLSGAKSKWYQVTKMSLMKPNASNPSNDFYELRLDDRLGDDVSSITTSDGTLAGAISHSIEFKKEEVENRPEFDGRFFAKIYRDDLVEEHIMLPNAVEEYSVREAKHIFHTKRYIDFFDQKEILPYYGVINTDTPATIPPDDFAYWNVEDGQYIAQADWDRDDAEGELDGKGMYVGTPFDPTQGDGGQGWGVQIYNSAGNFDVDGNDWNLPTGSLAFFTDSDACKKRRQTGDYFNNLKGKWCIDNTGAAYGGAGRGLHADHQGRTWKNTFNFTGNQPDNEFSEKWGWDKINASARVLSTGDYSTKNKADQYGRGTDSAHANEASGNAVANNAPNDAHFGPSGPGAYNVMHLSFFGPSHGGGGTKGGKEYEDNNGYPEILGNTNEQDQQGFASALDAGTLFRWAEDPNEQVYKIERVELQTGIRNYQSNKPVNHDNNLTDYDYYDGANRRLRYTIKFSQVGTTSDVSFGTNTPNKFNPIVNAVQIDGDPVTGPDGVVIQHEASMNRPYNFAGLDHFARNSLTMQILDPYDNDDDENKLQTDNPAIFETEPKENVELDIYYEVSPSYPSKDITEENNEMLLPIGSYFYYGNDKDKKVYTITKWTGPTTFEIDPDLNATADGDVADHSYSAGDTISIYTTYGGVVDVVLSAGVAASALSFSIQGGINSTLHQCLQPVILPFFNCISFGNGVESDRIRDDFNQPTIQNGVKASTTIAEQYREERRKYGLIYSGLYNSQAGINNLNQFIAGEKITKDLNPDYGSIQKLFTRDTNLLTLCEDKVLQINADKDALFNADGTSNVTSTDKFLGNAAAIAGEYGISKNPESFANYARSCYFTDAMRGSVMELTGSSLTPISQTGMADYFSDELKRTDLHTCLGTFDEKKRNYNLTLTNADRYYTSEQKTISYSQKSNAWTSFKTFYPEQGLSINNNYYTWKNGSMWQHHDSSVARCNFYDTTPSATTFASITPVFNDIPSSVKSFNLINYEGTQAKRDQFTTQTIDGITYNDGEYYNLTASTGWYCESITTDLQEGKVDEFKDKEGKWYNAIHGVATTLSNLDTTEFSVQGLGKAAVVSHDETAATVTVTVQDKASDPLEKAIVTSGSASVTAGATLSNTITLTICSTSQGLAGASAILYNNISINGVTGTDNGSNVTFSAGQSETVHGNLALIVLTQSGDCVTVTVTLEDTVSADTTIEIDFDWINLDLLQWTVPFDANVYNRSGTANPFIKNAVNYSNETITRTDISGITEGTAAALSGHSNITKQTHTGSLTERTETQVFSKTFTAASGYIYKKPFVHIDILDKEPNENSQYNRSRADSNRSNDDVYANRWRFKQTLTRDGDKNVTAVKVDGFYTSPDRRSEDARNREGTVISANDEARKNRGVMLTSMLIAKAPTISSQIQNVSYRGVKRGFAGFDEDKDVNGFIRILDRTAQGKLDVRVKGTASATGTLVITALDDSGMVFGTKERSFTLDSRGKHVENFAIPRNSAVETFEVHVLAGDGVTLGSNVPTATSPDEIHQFVNTTLTIQLTQTGSTYGGGGSLPAATQLTAAEAFTNYATDSDTVIGTKTDYHRTIAANKQQGETLHAWSFTVSSADSSDTTLVSSIKGSGTSGYVDNFTVTNQEFSSNGGTVCSVTDVFARESGNDVIFYGYVRLKTLGKDDVALQIPIDDLIST